MDDFMSNEFRHGEGVGTRIFEKKKLGLLQGSYKSNILITCCDEGMDTGLLLDLYEKTCS
jgi:hypothetical protein